jgi:hypothetical protein
MDFDLNATLNDTQAAVYAVDKRANQQAPSTLPIGIKLSVSPVSDTPVKRLAAYPALPTEVILQIAEHLSLDDIPAFSLVNKRTYYLMEERRWAWRCYQQAAHVSDLTSLQQLIDDIERSSRTGYKGRASHSTLATIAIIGAIQSTKSQGI